MFHLLISIQPYSYFFFLLRSSQTRLSSHMNFIEPFLLVFSQAKTARGDYIGLQPFCSQHNVSPQGFVMHPKTWLHKLLCALCVQRLSAGTDTMYIKVNMILKFLSEIFVCLFLQKVRRLCSPTYSGTQKPGSISYFVFYVFKDRYRYP